MNTFKAHDAIVVLCRLVQSKCFAVACILSSLLVNKFHSELGVRPRANTQTKSKAEPQTELKAEPLGT